MSSRNVLFASAGFALCSLSLASIARAEPPIFFPQGPIVTQAAAPRPPASAPPHAPQVAVPVAVAVPVPAAPSAPVVAQPRDEVRPLAERAVRGFEAHPVALADAMPGGERWVDLQNRIGMAGT